jgi:hypothetical protein
MLSAGLLSACAVLVAGGCGGGSTSAAKGADCTSLATTICNSAETCSPFYVSVNYGDVATCTARFALACKADASAPGAKVTSAEYAACGRGYAGFDCTDLIAALGGTLAPPGCLARGSRADGQPCGESTQCQSGHCQPNSVTCGTCEEPQPVDAACGIVADCQAGLTCSSYDQKCAEPQKAGGTCQVSTDCASGLICTSAGTCGKPDEAGDKCAGLGDCDGTKGLVCGAQQTCVPTKIAKAGEACGIVNGSLVVCDGGGFCAVAQGKTAGTCVAPAADGAACDTTHGPPCLPPADCINGTCSMPNTSSCG